MNECRKVGNITIIIKNSKKATSFITNSREGQCGAKKGKSAGGEWVSD